MSNMILHESPRANGNMGRTISLKKIIAAMLATMLGIGIAQAEAKVQRQHNTPKGWSDDISAILERAKADRRNVLVFVPLLYDEISFGRRKLSLIKQWTNPQATEAMGNKFALSFYPYGGPVPSDWRKVYGFTKGITPRLLILNQDGDLLWAGIASDFNDPDSNWGVLWMKEKYPELEKILRRVLPVRKRAATAVSEAEKAKMIFDVFKEFNPAIVQELFMDEVASMVAVDKDGRMGIRQHFPYFGYVEPIANASNDFWNARELKISQIRRTKRRISDSEAAKIVTKEMREEWEPKITKIVKAADKVEKLKGKLLNERELRVLKDCRKFANEVLRFWSGDVQDAPGYENSRK